jgi:hypothetical protein
MKVTSKSDTETTADYDIGYGKPPRHRGFQKGRSGNPKGRPKGSKNFATLLAEALDEKVQVTEDGKRRRVTKRELVIKQLVNKSASADLRAIKQLTDIVQGVERRAGASEAPPVAARLHRGRRGGDGDLHRSSAAILGRGASAERRGAGFLPER